MSFGRPPEKAGSRLLRSSMKTSKRMSAPDRNPRPLLAVFETRRRSVDRKGDVVRPMMAGFTERFSFPDRTSKNFGQSHRRCPESRSSTSTNAEAGAEQGQQSRSCRSQRPGRPSTKKSNTSRSAPQRYIDKNYPNGTDGISTAVIHRKLAKDQELEAELKEDGSWKLPSPSHDQIACSAAAKSNPADFWACPGMPNMPKLKPLIRL